MAEDLIINKGSKEEKYLSLIPQIEGLLTGETDLIANLANVAASLKEQFDWLWVGFYLLKNDELVLSPFQGPVACTRIQKGRGVCGKAWEQMNAIIVEDVSKFPGHIACSSLSKSEIVIPIISEGNFIGVLDVDSKLLNDFDKIDERFLKKIIEILEKNL
jgi:GAF domain-containing protein